MKKMLSATSHWLKTFWFLTNLSMAIPASARARKTRGSKIPLEAWIANVLDMVLVRHPAGSITFSVTNEPREGTVIPQYSPVMSGRRHKFGPGWFTFLEMSSRREMVPDAER